MFAALLAHEYGKGNSVRNAFAREGAPFKQTGLETFGDGLSGLHTENPIVACQIKVTVSSFISVRGDEARSIFASDAAGGVGGVMVDDYDFGAGKNHFEGSAEA